jgi:hypothetical protein
VKYPSLDWSKGVGEALSAFASMSLIAGGSRLKDSVIGFFTGDNKSSIETLADQMIEVAKKLNDPIWDTGLKYPKPEWSKGVGDALFAFANTFKILNDVDIDNDDFDSESILLISSLKSIAKHMEGQKWDNLPDTSGIKTWADGVMGGVSSFIEMISKIDQANYERADRKGLDYIIDSIVLSYTKLNKLKFSKIDGLEEWSKSLISIVDISTELGKSDLKITLNTFSDSIYDFALSISEIPSSLYTNSNILFKTIENLSNLKINDNIKNLSNLKINDNIKNLALSISEIPSSLYTNSNILIKTIENLSNLKINDNIKNLASSIRDLSDSLNTLNPDVIGKLNGFTGSMLVMSVVDSAKLEEFIEVLDNKKENLSDIISMGNMSQPVQSQIPITNVINNNSTNNQKDDNERFEKLMKRLETMSEYLSRMLEIEHIEGVDKFAIKNSNF